MPRKFLAFAGLLCLPLSGCVELEQVYTLNPDGSGKVRMEARVPYAGDLIKVSPQGAKPEAEDALEEKLRRHVADMLSKAEGVTAWKDVTAEFAPDGRLHFVGTAYFKNLDDLAMEKSFPLLGTGRLVRQPDGSLRLYSSAKKEPAPEKPPREPRTMTDKELDRHILAKRVEYQGGKPILTALLTDLKYRNVYQLPGTAQLPGAVPRIPGTLLKQEGSRGVSYAIEGNELFKAMKQAMEADNDTLRKKMRASNRLDLFEQMLDIEPGGPGSSASFKDRELATVAKPTGPQFDYQREVQEARAAYPRLRKNLGLGDEVKLPGEE
jgi:hypothetical protein